MKKHITYLFALSLFFCLPQIAFACSCYNEKTGQLFQKQGRVYIEPEQLAMSSNGIFIKVDENWFQTTALFSDATGIFIQDVTPMGYGFPDPYNACRNCQRCIHEEYDICPYCKKPA
jgi:hypothetical protein